MRILKALQVRGAADDVISQGDQPASRAQHAIHFPQQCAEVLRVMQGLPRDNQVEPGRCKRQTLSKSFIRLDGVTRFGRERADRSSAYQRTDVRLERAHLPALARERITRDPSPCSDV